VRTEIRSADAYNRRVTNISAKYTAGGTLNTPLYPSQASFLMTAAATLTGGPPPDLNSYTVDHFDGVSTPRRYLGGKMQSFGLEGSSDSQYVMTNSTWVFQSITDGVTLAQPALTEFPSEEPYLFVETVGKFTVGSGPTTITQYDNFKLSVANTVAADHYEAATIAYATWCGRDVNFDSHLTYVDSSWRSDFEAQTALQFVIEFYRSSTKNLTLTFETATILADRDQALPLAGVDTQSISAQAFFDVTASSGAGNDFQWAASYS
jgi:hypothetical protein